MRERDAVKRYGINANEFRRIRQETMREGEHFEREGGRRLGAIIYLDPGLRVLRERGLPIPAEPVVENPVETAVTVVKVSRKFPNKVWMEGVIGGGQVVRMRCRDSSNFMVGMEVPCVNQDGIYWVRRHPRNPGRW